MAPSLHSIKPSFAGGELAPSMYGRIDLAKYATGARTLKNMIVHPHGGVSNTPGTHYVSTGKTAGLFIRLHDFQFSSTQTYVIEFGNLYIRFYTRQGQITETGDPLTSEAGAHFITEGGELLDIEDNTPYEIVSPYATANLAGLSFTQSNDVLFIFHPDFQTRQLNRLADNSWTVTLYDFQFGPFQTTNTTATTITASALTGSVTLTASAATFLATNVGGLYRLEHDVAEQSVATTFSSVSNGTSISCGGTWRIISHGTWTGTFKVQKSTDGGSTWTTLRTFTSVNDFNVDTFGSEDMSDNASPFLVRAICSAYSSGGIETSLTTDPYIARGVAKVTAFTDTTHVTATVTRNFGATTATTFWAEGSWSDRRGWPAVGEFAQDRLCTGNTYTQPQTTWMTQTSNYYDYSVNSPVVDSDSISINLPTRQLNGINGFVSLTALIALTSSSEWAIGTPDSVLSPTTVTQKPNGYTGSNGLKPVIIKNRAIFVQAMGAFLQDMGFDLYSNSFTGADLSILANHLFTGYTITDMAYQQYPDSLVWCVRSDGALLSMTYLREQEVLAWTHHDLGGIVESICVIPYNGYNQLWLSVNRGGTRFVEYLDHRLSSTAPEDQFFVFSGLIYSGDPTSVVGNLAHLEGKSVAILADGNVVANYLTPQTVTGGQITLPAPASKVVIGLPYTSDLQTLDLEISLPDGTLQGRKSKVGKTVIRVVNSRGGYIGPDESNLKEIRDNDRTVYDNSLALKTGDLKQTLGGGYSDGGRIFIRQYDPLPLTISAIIPIFVPAGMTSE